MLHFENQQSKAIWKKAKEHVGEVEEKTQKRLPQKTLNLRGDRQLRQCMLQMISVTLDHKEALSEQEYLKYKTFPGLHDT